MQTANWWWLSCNWLLIVSTLWTHFTRAYVFSAVTYAWFLTGIPQEDYRAAVRARADIILFCPSCSRPDVDPVAESIRVAESETDILESEESYPR